MFKNKKGDFMELKRNKILNITFYIISIIFYTIISYFIYKLLVAVSYYYLFILIPLLFLFCTLNIINIVKMLLTIVQMVFGRNDNNEVSDYIDKLIKSTNQLCKYILIAIFTSLLTSVMILDIIYCLNKEKYTFIAFSIVIWILLYYFLFNYIVKMIRKQIRI